MRTLAIVPSADRCTDKRVREAIAIRNDATLTGHCPACGAEAQLPNRAQRRAAKRSGRVLHARMVHDADCLAHNESIRRLWIGGTA
jgi:hypothetical protein